MKVILKSNQEGLGAQGDMVEVAPGFARNFLFPKDLALKATPKNMCVWEEEKKVKASRQKKEEGIMQELADKLSTASCTITMQVGEEEKLFGSVTSQDIAETLLKEGIEIDKRKIVLEEPIKTLGVYRVPVKLHAKITAEVKVWVVAK